MNFLLTIFFLLLIISVLVFVHELGHFLAAKLIKVPVDEFAIGFGPKIFSKKYKGTNYAVNLLPIGGYVQLEGESSDISPDSFRNKRFIYKAFVLLAGVIMNLLLAIILLAFFLNANGYKFALPKLANYTFSNTDLQGTYFPITIISVDPQGPSNGKLFINDIIVGIDGHYFNSYPEFQNLLKERQNTNVEVDYLDRDTYTVSSKRLDVSKADDKGAILRVTLDYDRQNNKPAYFIKYKSTLFSGVSMTYDVFVYEIKALGSLLRNSFQTGNYEEVSKNVGSLPAIANQVDQAVQLKAYDFLIPLTAVFSINLALVNVLPFPGLDGGQLFIAFIEKVRKKKIPDETLAKINSWGIAILMGFGLIIIIKDVIQFKWIDGLLGIVKGVLGK